MSSIQTWPVNQSAGPGRVFEWMRVISMLYLELEGAGRVGGAQNTDRAFAEAIPHRHHGEWPLISTTTGRHECDGQDDLHNPGASLRRTLRLRLGRAAPAGTPTRIASPHPWRSLIAALAAGIAHLAGSVAAARVTGLPLRAFLIDPTAEFGAPAYIGVVSNVTVLVWWSAAVVACLSGLVLRRLDHPSAAPLLLLAALSGAAGADDLYLGHEKLIPSLGVPQKVVLIIFAAVAASALWTVRDSSARASGACSLLRHHALPSPSASTPSARGTASHTCSRMAPRSSG